MLETRPKKLRFHQPITFNTMMGPDTCPLRLSGDVTRGEHWAFYSGRSIPTVLNILNV